MKGKKDPGVRQSYRVKVESSQTAVIIIGEQSLTKFRLPLPPREIDSET
jgi:hypothetical protein